MVGDIQIFRESRLGWIVSAGDWGGATQAPNLLIESLFTPCHYCREMPLKFLSNNNAYYYFLRSGNSSCVLQF